MTKKIPKTKVKICGLSTPDTLTATIEAGADFIGLVFYPPSPRHIEVEVASYLSKQVPDTIQIVGLFVDPTDQLLEKVLNEVPLTMIQLHGRETPDRVTHIKEKFQLPVIKAVSIENTGDLTTAKSYDGIADWLLFDAKGKKLPGGNGISFDWEILKNYQGYSPWMVAGGLTPENVGQALKILSPNAVDVSSGIESKTGIKDCSKIRSFLEAVKKA